MTEGKEVPVQEVLADIKQGLSDNELMTKYGISRFLLDFLFKKLIDGGLITQAELDARGPSLIVVPSASATPGVAMRPEVAAGEPRPPDEVLHSYERKAFWLLVISTILGLLAGGIAQAGDAGMAVSVLVNLVGFVLYFWGFYCLVKRKGYHWAMTFLGFLSCIGLLIMVLIKDKYEAPRTGYMTAIIVVILFPLVVAIIGIILAVAIPYYVSYKRTACDNLAQQELSRIQAAYDTYRNDPNNRTNESPRDLGPLVGYYGWAGTAEKCLVLIKYHPSSQEAEAVALKGSHPQGTSSRYVYRRNLATGSEEVSSVRDLDSSTFRAYRPTGPGVSSGCFDENGTLREECRGKQP